VAWQELTAQYPVVVFEGCDGTGKSTLATLLGTRYGYTVIRSGRLTADQGDGADAVEGYRARRPGLERNHLPDRKIGKEGEQGSIAKRWLRRTKPTRSVRICGYQRTA